MSSTAPSPAAERLAGIEWMRGVAAFGVICIHAGLAVHNRTTPVAGVLLPEFFGFAVPFFLMTSFFFTIRAEEIQRLSWSDWMQRRAGRLLVPFAFWSTIYLALHVGKLMLHHQDGEIKALLGDPAALILSGGDSLALYFVPLLFTGLVLIRWLSGPLQRLSSWGLVIGFFAGLALHVLFHRYSGRVNALLPSIAEAPLRLALGLMREAARCAPLVFVAALLTRYLPPPGRKYAYPFILTGAIYLVIPHFISPPASASDSVLGLGAFLLAWGLSGLLPASKWAVTVGLFSFGVYLVHQIFLELIQTAFPYRQPSGALMILSITAAVFVASMLTVGLANRGGLMVRRIFGLK